MLLRLMPLAIWLLLARCAALRADEIGATELEQRFTTVEQQYSTPYPVRAAQYASNAGEVLPAPTGPGFGYPPPPPAPPANLGPPSPNATVYIPPQGSPPGDADMFFVAPGCRCCDNVYRNSNWNIGFDIIPTQSNVTRAEFGPWPDDGALALRLNLGYEDPTGYGFRARLWAFGQEDAAPADVDLGASTIDLDLYKRVFIENSEVVFGGGPVGSHLRFTLPNDDYSRFTGGGVTVFAEGFHPISRFVKTDVGAVVRARMSLLEGDWRDTTGSVIASTNHDSMSIAELAWGLEMRRRFGPCEDHFWFAALLFEHQRWESDWMGAYIGSAVAFDGLNISLGLAW